MTLKVDGLESPDLYSVTMTLEAVSTSLVPDKQGYQAYSMFLNLLRASHPAMTEELHDKSGTKPFTISPLKGRFLKSDDGYKVIQGARYTARLTFLNSSGFALFIDSVLKWGDTPVDIGQASFKIIEVETINLKKTSQSSYNSYRGIYDNASADRTIELEFLSPTAFRSNGHHIVLPNPPSVFGGYWHKWRTFSPIEIDQSILSWMDKILISRHCIATKVLPFGLYQQIGFIGRCAFEIGKDVPTDIVHQLNALADFSFYAGTGAKTTMGMGQTRKISRNRYSKTEEAR